MFRSRFDGSKLNGEFESVCLILAAGLGRGSALRGTGFELAFLTRDYGEVAIADMESARNFGSERCFLTKIDILCRLTRSDLTCIRPDKTSYLLVARPQISHFTWKTGSAITVFAVFAGGDKCSGSKFMGPNSMSLNLVSVRSTRVGARDCEELPQI